MAPKKRLRKETDPDSPSENEDAPDVEDGDNQGGGENQDSHEAEDHDNMDVDNDADDDDDEDDDECSEEVVIADIIGAHHDGEQQFWKVQLDGQTREEAEEIMSDETNWWQDKDMRHANGTYFTIVHEWKREHEGDMTYTADSIIDMRRRPGHRTPIYKVLWAGYAHKNASWVPGERLEEDLPDMVAEYLEERYEDEQDKSYTEGPRSRKRRNTGAKRSTTAVTRRAPATQAPSRTQLPPLPSYTPAQPQTQAQSAQTSQCQFAPARTDPAHDNLDDEDMQEAPDVIDHNGIDNVDISVPPPPPPADDDAPPPSPPPADAQSSQNQSAQQATQHRADQPSGQTQSTIPPSIFDNAIAADAAAAAAYGWPPSTAADQPDELVRSPDPLDLDNLDDVPVEDAGLVTQDFHEEWTFEQHSAI